MFSTADWAIANGISTDRILPAVEEYTERYPRTAQEIALRAIILQGVVVVACEVDPEPIIDWFHEQDVWEAVSPREKAFLLDSERTEKQCNNFRWREEAEWALLWMIGKVEALGLPTHRCDTRQLVDEIIPPLGSPIADFLASADLREPGVLLAEDLRAYDLWCAVWAARRKHEPLPDDLNIDVLYERVYAFEWLDVLEPWDNVTCDA